MTDNQVSNQDNNGSNRKKIKLDDDDDSYTGVNIRDINIIFYCVWRNKVIRNEILFHTRLFNIHLGVRIDFTLNELSTYKYKSYLDMVLLYDEKEGKERQQQFIPSSSQNVNPFNVSEVSFYIRNLLLLDNSIPNTVTSLKFLSFPINQEFTKGILPDSITNLEFGFGTSFNQSFANRWLPNSLKTLSLPLEFQKDIRVNQLPKSLTELNFMSYFHYKGKIVPGSIPPIAAAKPLDYTFTWKCENELTNEISNSTIGYGIGQCIKKGDIPNNAISIKFSEFFNGEIQGALPASLKSLEFDYFPKISIGENLSSSNLTSIDMGNYNLQLVPNLFPLSIISITFHKFNQPIPDGYFYKYVNLKSLKFHRLNRVITEKTLPPLLTLLDLGWDFNKDIKENILPSSLSILSLSYRYHTLNVNVLPVSLSTLEIRSSEYILGINQLPISITSLSIATSHQIPVGSLPCNLKQLYITNSNFNQDLTIEGILPKSIQSIYFSFKIDKNYINNLDFDFFKKYIKFK